LGLDAVLVDLLATFLVFLFCSNDNLMPASNNADISGVRLTPPVDLFNLLALFELLELFELFELFKEEILFFDEGDFLGIFISIIISIN
jgi:hypothetical protein